jgi:hypothetical protein
MTTPDYLEQVVVSGRRRPNAASAPHETGPLSPSLTSVIWAGLDFTSAVVGGLIAFRIRTNLDSNVQAGPFLTRLVPMPPVESCL